MTTCSACGANSGPTSRFCTGCGRSVHPSSRAAATATATGTLTDELNRVGEQVNQTARQWSESGKEQVRSWGVRWSESAAIAGIGLSPLLVLGLAAGIALMFVPDSDIRMILAAVGLLIGLAFGGGISLEAGNSFFGGSLANVSLSVQPLGLTLVTLAALGFALWRGVRRADPTTAVRQLVIPAVAMFVLGTVLLAGFASSTHFFIAGFGLTPGTDRLSTMVWSLVGSVVTAAVILVITRRDSTRLGSFVTALRAPLIAVGALWGVLSLLGGVGIVILLIGHGVPSGQVLAAAGGLLLVLPNLGLFALSAGTLGSIQLDAPYPVIDLLQMLDLPTTVSMLTFTSEFPALLWFVAAITALGIAAALGMFGIDPSPAHMRRNILSFVGLTMAISLLGAISLGITLDAEVFPEVYDAIGSWGFVLRYFGIDLADFLGSWSIGLGFSALMVPVTGLFAAAWALVAWWIRPLLVEASMAWAS